jgi:hypothetical protein
MTKFLSTLVIFGGALMVALYLNAQGVGRVEAREEPAQTVCRNVEVPLDEGYGISRMELRSVCYTN